MGRHKDDCEADDADNASGGEPQKDEGDEVKEKDAKYFYACVQEYGVYGDNKKFNRKWKLFGTTMH